MTAHHLPSQHDRAAAGRSLRILIFAALTGVALLAQPLSAFAAGTFYVDITNPAASASGPGTEAQPFSTISAAINVQKGPGTTILVKPGTYREMVTINASGSSGNPFVIQAFGSPVIVDGADDLSATSKWAAYSGNIYVASSVNWGPMQVFIDGVRLTASTASPAFLPTNSFVWVSGQGLFVNVGGGNPGTHACLVGHRTSSFYLSGRSYITIDGFVTTRTDDRAIRLGSSSNNCVIRNNTCTFNFKYGIYISGCSNDLVEKNVVSDNADHGINLSSSSTLPTSFCTIQDNESFRNAHPTIRKATGILVIGSPNNLIQRNRLHDNQDSGLQIDTGSDNCVSVQNRSWNNGDHGFDQLYCNGVSHVGDVAYNNFKDGFSIEGTAPNGSVYDCIAINNGLTTNEFNLWVNDSSSVGFHSDYNIFWNSTSRQPIKFINTQYSTIAAFTSATGQDAHSTQIDPKFQNPALGDFHLQPGSLAGQFSGAQLAGHRCRGLGPPRRSHHAERGRGPDSLRRSRRARVPEQYSAGGGADGDADFGNGAGAGDAGCFGLVRSGWHRGQLHLHFRRRLDRRTAEPIDHDSHLPQGQLGRDRHHHRQQRLDHSGRREYQYHRLQSRPGDHHRQPAGRRCDVRRPGAQSPGHGDRS
jgi:parallel beta-helix repeat protein